MCYLAYDNPTNDLKVLLDYGILPQNVWAVQEDEKKLKEACESITNSNLRNVRLFKGNILIFLKDFEGQFDIIYFDACGTLDASDANGALDAFDACSTLPAPEQETLKSIGYVFLYNKLTSPGADHKLFISTTWTTETGTDSRGRVRTRQQCYDYR